MVRQCCRGTRNWGQVAASRIHEVRISGGVVVRRLVPLVFCWQPNLSPGVMRQRGNDGYGTCTKRSERVGPGLRIPAPLSVVHPIGKANRVVPGIVIRRMVSTARNDAVLASREIAGGEADFARKGTAHNAVVEKQSIGAAGIFRIQKLHVLAGRDVVRANSVVVANSTVPVARRRVIGIAGVADRRPVDRHGRRVGHERQQGAAKENGLAKVHYGNSVERLSNLPSINRRGARVKQNPRTGHNSVRLFLRG